MDIPLAGPLAILSYLLAALCFAVPRTARPAHHESLRLLGLLLAAIALASHGYLLYDLTLTVGGRVNLGLFNAAALVAWCCALVAVALSTVKPADSLVVVLLPLAATMLALDTLIPGTKLLLAHLPFGMRLHIALSILAYSLFFVATVQALFLAVAQHKLRQHTPIMSFLPPLPVMEGLMFQLTAIAFGLLTLSLVLGVPYIEDIRGQHLSHKIAFSVLAWLVFATLVLGHLRFDWRGRRALKYVIAGFTLLALAYFGSKIALELVLHRV